jgi:hypothetical protein
LDELDPHEVDRNRSHKMVIPDWNRSQSVGAANKNSGKFDKVQYRRNPTFLRRMSQRYVQE